MIKQDSIMISFQREVLATNLFGFLSAVLTENCDDFRCIYFKLYSTAVFKLKVTNKQHSVFCTWIIDGQIFSVETALKYLPPPALNFTLYHLDLFI